MELGQVSPLEVDGTGNLPVQIDCTGFMLNKSKAFILNLYIQWQDITISDRRAGQKHGFIGLLSTNSRRRDGQQIIEICPKIFNNIFLAILTCNLVKE